MRINETKNKESKRKLNKKKQAVLFITALSAVMVGVIFNNK